MSFQFRPAKRSEAKPLLGIYSLSGCGKTWSSLMLARGFVGPSGKVGMIETESGRGEAYADLLPGGYTVCSIRGDFSPQAYGEALTAAEGAELDALIIDSASHEWEADGGVLAMAAKNEADGKKGRQVWTMPKLLHARHFMLRLLGTPIPLVIVCMRAKYPLVEVVRDGKKDFVRSEVPEPKQSDDILFEMFVHGWIDAQHRFQGTKYTRDDLRQVIPTGQPISLETGKALARWAAEAETPTAPKPSPAPPDERSALMSEIRRLSDAAKLSPDDRRTTWTTYVGSGIKPEHADLAQLADLLGYLRTRAGERVA